MSGISQYQSVFRVAKPEAKTNGTQSRALKRNRQAVSCVACRTRKMKCDRQVPCLACSKRGDEASCNYHNSSKSGRDGHNEGGRAAEAQSRLQKLEQMVTSLMQATKDSLANGSSKPVSQKASVDEHMKDLAINAPSQSSQPSMNGHLDSHGSETQYVGATNWAAILENIHDIQGYLEPDEELAEDGDEEPSSALRTGPDLALDSTQPLTVDDVCKALPPRPVLDNLLSGYFQAGHVHTPTIHRGKFKKEYESFWADPSSVSFLWISMLFAIMWVGSKFSQEIGQDSRDGSAGAEYFKLAGQALIAGKYRKARPYSVEAVLLYAQCKYLQREDPDADAWMIMGIATRLALRMGYHRDPRHLKNISPFEGEMRRRTFAIVETFDNLFSFQAGLPAIINEADCDAEPPSNLFDEDFDEDCKVVPPSRPPTDPTPMLYYCYKCRFSKLFKRVIKHVLALKPPSYEATMELDRLLDREYAEIPQSLRWRPLSTSFTDQAPLIINRLNIEITCVKSRAVLHRKYLNYERSNPIFAYSRKACIDAALQILQYQAELYAATQPGGRFHNNKWLYSSILSHDFLLAAMIVCLDLYESHRELIASTPIDLEAQVRRFDALHLSHEIWTSRRGVSRDARRASNVLASMLSRVPRPHVQVTPQNGNWEPLSMPQALSNGRNLQNSTSNSSGSSPWHANTFNLLDQGLAPEATTDFDFMSLDPLNSVFTQSDFVDWGFVDQYFPNYGDAVDGSLDWQLQEPSGL